ncbi:ERCC4 domain-containing protein [Marinobacter subterrani]|uniref:ERCC4 domain-containing protein n=1 Tax=Marinobacter subterrani TaxID=1658765 RepID=UPI0023545D00|nr:ERCC4 domain-containing protein [Marinobacter subterrani]
MLRLWRHPKTQAIRLYFSKKTIANALADADVALDPETVKGWIQQNRSGRPEVWVSVKSEVTNNRAPLSGIRDALERTDDFLASDSWDTLVEQAQNPKSYTKPQSEPPVSPENHCEANNHDAEALETTDDHTAAAGSDAQNRKRYYEAGRLDITSIKMPKPITIEVDHRETRLISDLLSAHPLISVETSQLELADFRITDREGNELLIERKRCTGDGMKTDFEASIQTSGRLFDQSERLRFQVSNSDHQVIPVIILEGNVHANATSMLLQQVDGAISFIAAVQRISLLSTYNANHSAYAIAKLASHFIDGLYTPVSLHQAKPKALFSQKTYVLESLPGISTKIAEALLEHFGSVRAVTQASEGELVRVPGIGAKRAREISRVLGEA